MSDIPSQGSEDNPVRLDNHLFGPILTEVHWPAKGKIGVLTVTSPDNAAFYFSGNGFFNAASSGDIGPYAEHDVIPKDDYKDKDVSEVQFTNSDPLSTFFHYEATEWIADVIIPIPTADINAADPFDGNPITDPHPSIQAVYDFWRGKPNTSTYRFIDVPDLRELFYNNWPQSFWVVPIHSGSPPFYHLVQTLNPPTFDWASATYGTFSDGTPGYKNEAYGFATGTGLGLGSPNKRTNELNLRRYVYVFNFKQLRIDNFIPVDFIVIGRTNDLLPEYTASAELKIYPAGANLTIGDRDVTSDATPSFTGSKSWPYDTFMGGETPVFQVNEDGFV